MIRNGTAVAASSASASGTPRPWRSRTASIIVSELPASTPSGPLATPSLISTSSPPRLYEPSPLPAPAIESVTRATRPPPTVQIKLGRIGSEVNAVEDHLDDHVIRESATPVDAGIAVAERAHGVEEVRDGLHAEVEGRVRLGRVRIRVAAGDRDSAPMQQVDKRAGAWELGRERDEPHRAGCEQALEQLGVGISARSLGMSAEPLRGEEGPLEVRAEDVRALRVVRDLRQRGDELFLGGRDERRQVRRDARLQERLAGDPVAGGVRVEEIDASEAIHLKIDETGRGHTLAVGGRKPDAPDMAFDDLDVPRHELTPDQSCFDAESHESRAARIRPSAASSRERAVSASTSASSDTMATLASPPALSRAASTSSGGAPVASSTIRRTRARSLSFVARTSTMRFPKVLPVQTIDTVEIVLRTSFCAVPDFSRVEPAKTRAHDDGDLVVDERGERRVGRGDHSSCERAGRRSRLDGTDDITASVRSR